MKTHVQAFTGSMPCHSYLQTEPEDLQIVILILISGKATEQPIQVGRARKPSGAVKIVHADFIKTLDTMVHNILLHMLLKHRLDKCTVRWTESCLNSLAKVVISRMKPN